LIAISALRRRHYGPAHKIPDSSRTGGEFCFAPTDSATANQGLGFDEGTLAFLKPADRKEHLYQLNHSARHM
jgi:hypothetical protein